MKNESDDRNPRSSEAEDQSKIQQLKILLQLNEYETCPYFLKWRILSRIGKIGSGKNTKYFFSYRA